MRGISWPLHLNGEKDIAKNLYDEASKIFGNASSLHVTIGRASALSRSGQKFEALQLLEATLPKVKACGDAEVYYEAMLNFAGLFKYFDRKQEAHETAAQLIEYSMAKFGPEDSKTLLIKDLYACTCADLGRFAESKKTFENVLTAFTRIFGRDHPFTESTRTNMQRNGFL